MGKLIAVLAVLLTFLGTSIPTSYARRNSEEIYKQKRLKGKDLKRKAQQIQLIEGTPNRPYKKIAPIWESGHSLWGARPNMQKTIEKAKKQAAKLGADAIIEFKVGTGQASVGSGGVYVGTGYGAGGWGVASNPAPVVEGWAVKWIDKPSSTGMGMEAPSNK